MLISFPLGESSKFWSAFQAFLIEMLKIESSFNGQEKPLLSLVVVRTVDDSSGYFVKRYPSLLQRRRERKATDCESSLHAMYTVVVKSNAQSLFMTPPPSSLDKALSVTLASRSFLPVLLKLFVQNQDTRASTVWRECPPWYSESDTPQSDLAGKGVRLGEKRRHS